MDDRCQMTDDWTADAFGLEWAGVDLNHRHTDFQSVALPTELPARQDQVPAKKLNLTKITDIARKLGYNFSKLDWINYA